tara:strand:- start:223 stop:954 length:732 start_codon:yes stop_codon:yes gene_type:complete
LENQTIFGLHSVKAALLNKKRRHIELIVNENHRDFAKKFQGKIKKISIIDHKEFKRKYGGEQSTQGVVLKTKRLEVPSLENFLEEEEQKANSVIIMLDQITDPQNIGSIMRSCALFNCKCMVVAKDNAPDLTPSLLKAASGAAEIVNYFKVINLRRTLSILKKNNYWVYGFDSSKYKQTDINFHKKSVLVFGSEGKGIRELIKKESDILIQLKSKPNLEYNIDSLNVSNASAIALYEFYKKFN